MPGPELSTIQWKECLKLLEEQKQVEYIVASGSLARGIPVNIYGQIAEIAKQKNARLIVDTSGEALKEAVNIGVYMIKPNLAELSSLVGKQEIHAELVDDVAMQLIEQGKCEMMVVSLGQAGAMLISKKDAIQMIPPVVKRKSTVGAGDSMVAGFVLAISQGRSSADALRYGIACGTAATMNEGTGLCRKEDVEKIISACEICISGEFCGIVQSSKSGYF